jgi:hypothetical protein
VVRHVRRCELDIPQGIFNLHLSQLDQPQTDRSALKEDVSS